MTDAAAPSVGSSHRPAWGLAALALMVCEVLMIALAFGWVAIYSYFIHTGEDAAFYEAYAQVASPWVALITGIPILFLSGRWLAGKLGAERARVTAFALIGFWVVLEVVVFAAAGSDFASFWMMWVANLVTKAAAVILGAKGAS